MQEDFDEQMMRRAIELARNATGRTSPNPLVGAVVVKEGRIVAEGWHRQAGTPHAEVRALAVRSADATKEINTMITSVIEDVQKSNDSIIDTVNKMDAIAQNAGQLQNTLDVITQKVGDVHLEITQIATATEQQTGTSKEMSTHLQQIKSNTQDVTIVLILVSSLAVNNAIVNQIEGTTCTLVDSSCFQVVDVCLSAIRIEGGLICNFKGAGVKLRGRTSNSQLVGFCFSVDIHDAAIYHHILVFCTEQIALDIDFGTRLS